MTIKREIKIPRIIHYCWFGQKPLPELALKCIESWKQFFPDFEIRRWDETNFDVNSIPYTQYSYKAGKFAFVSDYARYSILYQTGGIYFDTDVRVIKSFDDILERGPFLGIEKDRNIISVAPGLGMGAIPEMQFYKKMLEIFENWMPQNLNETPPPLLVKKTTETLCTEGFELIDKEQQIGEIFIYPSDYFDPMDDYTGKIKITGNTRSIHYYAKSWIKGYGPMKDKTSKLYHRLISLFKK